MEPGVFGSLEPEPEPLEKKPGAGAAWEKKSGAGAAWKKSQEPEPEPEKKLPAPQPWARRLFFPFGQNIYPFAGPLKNIVYLDVPLDAVVDIDSRVHLRRT